MKYTIQGTPVPLARARHGKGRTYNAQILIQQRFKLELMLQHRKRPLLEGALHLDITFFMPMPRTWSDKKRASMMGQPHVSRPDLSNLLKMYEDCGTLILYKDDSLISSITAKKIYDYHPRTELILTEKI